MTDRYLAIDIGAESGRAMIGSLEAGQLKLEEIYRFPNRTVIHNGSLRWDIHQLLAEVRKSVELAGPDIVSVGVDTWAVDHVLLDENGELLDLPYCYRDSRTDGVMEKVFELVPKFDLYRTTGVQFLPFNTLYQLYSMVLSGDEVLKKAARFLTIPDYLHACLVGSGDPVCEYTNATTTQFLDARTGDWAWDLLKALGIPLHIFPKVVKAGTCLGQLPGTKIHVVAPATHDTGSAVAAVHSEGAQPVWISSGTWSIVGIESPEPLIDRDSLQANLSNEGGYESFRVGRNVMGLWILQQCRETWANAGHVYSYEELQEMASSAESGVAFFDPDDAVFLPPGDMPARIQDKVGSFSHAQIVRIVLESLAMKYRYVMGLLRGEERQEIHVIGGGSRNGLLNQLTADVCQMPVIAGPFEATAIGNLLVQIIASGKTANLHDAREIVRRSFEFKTFQPQPSALVEKYDEFLSLVRERVSL